MRQLEDDIQEKRLGLQQASFQTQPAPGRLQASKCKSHKYFSNCKSFQKISFCLLVPRNSKELSLFDVNQQEDFKWRFSETNLRQSILNASNLQLYEVKMAIRAQFHMNISRI